MKAHVYWRRYVFTLSMVICGPEHLPFRCDHQSQFTVPRKMRIRCAWQRSPPLWPALLHAWQGRFPKTVFAYQSAFGGMIVVSSHLTGGSRARVMELSGLQVVPSGGVGQVNN